jgi:cystine transport system substrate-binding protein
LASSKTAALAARLEKTNDLRKGGGGRQKEARIVTNQRQAFAAPATIGLAAKSGDHRKLSGRDTPIWKGLHIMKSTLFKNLRLLLLAGLLPLLAAASACAADDLAQIKSAGVFRIGTEGTYAPFTYHDASGQLTGFDVEMGRAIAQRLGVKAEFVEGKWDGLIAGLDVKRYDAVMNEVGITDARKAKYDFSDAYIVSHPAIIVRSDDASIQSVNDLKGKRAAETLTSNYGQIVRNHGGGLVPVQGFNEAIELVISGRVDATVNDSLSFLDFKKHRPDAKVRIAAIDASNSAPSAVLIRKGNPQLQAAINKALADLKIDGSYARISEKYFGKDVSQ